MEISLALLKHHAQDRTFKLETKKQTHCTSSVAAHIAMATEMENSPRPAKKFRQNYYYLALQKTFLQHVEIINIVQDANIRLLWFFYCGEGGYGGIGVSCWLSMLL